MNLSIASYAFHGLLSEGKMDLFGYLESCRYRYQLHTADIWNGMITSTEDEYLAKVKEGLVQRELELVNLCVDGPDVWNDNPEVREQHYQNALVYLHAAEFLGARTIRINSGVRGDNFTEEQFDWVVNHFREYAQRAYDNGYRVGPENHWGAEVKPENMKRICEAVNHPGFGVLLHFKGERNEIMAPWAMHTHIAWDIAEGPLDKSIEMLTKVGYQGCWGVEHHSAKMEYVRVAIHMAKVQEGLLRAGIS